MKKSYLILPVIVFITMSCGQMNRLTTLQKCEFKLEKIDILEINKTDVSGIKSYKDIDLATAGKLALTLFDSKSTLKYKVNLKANNPNKMVAGMNKMDILVIFNNEQIAEGGISSPVEILPGGQADIPIILTSNVSKVINNIDKKVILSLLFPLEGGTSSLFTIKLKPGIKIRNKEMTYPGYITLSYDFKTQ